MPHIHVKIFRKTNEEKAKLAAAINQAVQMAVNADEANISICIEDIEKADWGGKRFINPIFLVIGISWIKSPATIRYSI